MKKNQPYNPFLVAGYYGPEYFCDRETETAKIISALENDRNISLMSPRLEGHTWYVQAVLNRLFEYRKDINKPEIVFSAILELLEENTYGYQELLNAYSNVQVNLLRAIAKEKVIAQINSGDFISKYRLKNSSSINRALKKLTDNELIYKSEKGYTIYDRFLGLWLIK